jgi:hypothetical protein
MNRDLTSLDELRQKQQQLMESVPHPLREDAYRRMLAGKKIIENVVIYLNSTGHKPWRPNPLPRDKQLKALLEIGLALLDLELLHEKYPEPSKFINDTKTSRILVSTFGGMEELIEFFNSWGWRSTVTGWSGGASNEDLNKKWYADMLEELVDELFFFLERMVLVGFSWSEVVTEYHRKWRENMERYKKAKEGDYSWDKRSEKEGL